HRGTCSSTLGRPSDRPTRRSYGTSAASRPTTDHYKENAAPHKSRARVSVQQNPSDRGKERRTTLVSALHEDDEIREEASQLIDQASVLSDAAAAETMHEKDSLLVFGLDRDEAHVWSAGRLADGDGVVEVVLSCPTALAIWGDEAWIDDACVVAEAGELARPVVGAGAGFHGDQSRWCIGEELEKLLALESFAQYDLAVRVDATQGE